LVELTMTMNLRRDMKKQGNDFVEMTMNLRFDGTNNDLVELTVTMNYRRNVKKSKTMIW